MIFRRHTLLVTLLAGCSLMVSPARAEDPTLPTFRSFAGAFLVGDDHNFFVESELQLPVMRGPSAGLYYRHRESTPFLDLDDGIQAELMFTRDELMADYNFNRDWRLIAVGGYQSVHNQDRPGLASAYAAGAGAGSPLRTNGERLHWYALAGTYMDRRALDSDWWTDLYLSWRTIDFAMDQYMGSRYRASVCLSADVQSSNEGSHFRALYKIGPEIQLLTANGNRANLQFRWYYNDNNPFYGFEEDGLLLGLDVTSSHDDDYVLHARDRRQSGWLPMIWGDYDVGIGSTRRMQRFTMNVEVADFLVRDHPFTGFIWYETRQEHRIGDFDNVSYSVSLGIQTPVGLESALSQDDPLVLGCDFVHRSDHSLNPPADRVAADGEPTSIGPMIPNGSINILPRFRLQTLGWSLPYRDPSMYQRKTAWLHSVDWRITAGLTAETSRTRESFSGQIGLNWDIATLQGYVLYLHGVGSIGDETPDWLGEVGVRRPAMKVFTRYESYGINGKIARGATLVAGLGVYL